MTYSVNITGHGDEPYEEREAAELALVKALIDALDARGGNVVNFNFQGNEVKIVNFQAAKDLLEPDKPKGL